MSARIYSAIWLSLFGIYVLSVPGTFYFEDSPELMSAAFTLGNSHPPGYGLMMLLGRLAMLLPVGSLPFRFNLMSAAAGAGAAVALAGFTFSLARCFTGRRIAVASGVFAAGIWGLSDAFWWQASIGDKYPLYYLLFICVVWSSWEACRSSREDFPRQFLLAVLLAGLAFTHHLYSLFALPALALAAARLYRQKFTNLPRILAVALLLALVPLSVKVMYPPIRSSAGAELDWGQPGNLGRLREYLQARLYHEAFSSVSVGEEKGVWTQRGRLFSRLLGEELPLPLVAAAPAGLLLLVRGAPWAAAAIGGCMAADAAFALNFFGEVVRWYEPFFALLCVLSAVGLAWGVQALSSRIPESGPRIALAVFLVLAGPSWQYMRGWQRNSLSRFYSAHGMARNIMMSVPPGGLYLGSGDFDLFPLWAARYLFDERLDMDAIGLGSFANAGLAGMGGQVRVLRDLGIKGTDGGALLALVTGKKRPLLVPGADYDPKLWEALPFLKVNRCYGLASLLLDHWDPGGSYYGVRRAMRACSMRGLLYARSGAVFDLSRVRDETARGALLHYPGIMCALGGQLFRWGMYQEAAWVFESGFSMMEPLAGPVSLPALPSGVPGSLAGAQSARAALSGGFLELADMFESRGVVSIARVMRNNASAMSR
jgi:hypothetical protein